MQYCIYLRKSRADIEAEANGEGETLARHERILFGLAKKMKINITKIYKEIVSGETISSRPMMQQLLSDVEKGVWEGVLVVEVERLARGDTIDQGTVAQTFKYSNTKIITPMKVYNPANEFDEEYFEFGLFMSRREYKTINRRLQQGRMQSVKEGKYLGTIAPYGYKRKKLKNQKGYTLEPIPKQADIVRLIYKWYTSESKRIGVSLIARKLNNMKVPTAKGGDWTTSTIRGILGNPVYMGKIRWNARPVKKKVIDGEIIKERPRAKKKDVIIIDGLHEGIVDEKTFNLTQHYLAKNSTLPVPTRYKIKNPLAGLIVCGMCGRKMNRRPHKGDYPDTLMCTGPTCNNISSHLHLVEEKLLSALEDWLDNYKMKINNAEKQNSDLEVDVIKKSIKELDKELETLEKQFNKLHDLLEQGIYSTEKFLERSRVLNEKINTINNDKETLKKSLKDFSAKEKNKKLIIPKVEKVIEGYKHIKDPAKKNKLLKEVLEKVVYTKTVNGRWHGKKDDFELLLYPKISR
ncbi:recombinase family protein [Dethiothermospora halolimnae]|uniref:recombinase family protein n=1 Tax=Dethiothermospora halolimnae TaxID=3114390 RepID=UPI003CCC2167